VSVPGDAVLWRLDLQEPKRPQTGGVNVRYRAGAKARYVAELTEIMGRILPECRIRYAF